MLIFAVKYEHLSSFELVSLIFLSCEVDKTALYSPLQPILTHNMTHKVGQDSMVSPLVIVSDSQSSGSSGWSHVGL